MPDASALGGSRQFFSQLPMNGFTEPEITLREALLNYLSSRNPADGWPVITAAGHCNWTKAIQKAKSAFLPRDVPLQEWIEKRIGGEVMTHLLPNGQFEVILASKASGKGGKGKSVCKGTGKGQKGEKGEKGEKADNVNFFGAREPAFDSQPVDDPRDADGKKRKFLASLPTDGFTDTESRLRDAILGFLHRSGGSRSLSDAGSDQEIRDARLAFMPKGCGVSIREWIEHRIGGEVETFANPQNKSDFFFGLRGQTDPEAALRDRKRRKKGGKGAGGEPGESPKGRGRHPG